MCIYCSKHLHLYIDIYVILSQGRRILQSNWGQHLMPCMYRAADISWMYFVLFCWRGRIGDLSATISGAQKESSAEKWRYWRLNERSLTEIASVKTPEVPPFTICRYSEPASPWSGNWRIASDLQPSAKQSQPCRTSQTKIQQHQTQRPKPTKPTKATKLLQPFIPYNFPSCNA